MNMGAGTIRFGDCVRRVPGGAARCPVAGGVAGSHAPPLAPVTWETHVLSSALTQSRGPVIATSLRPEECIGLFSSAGTHYYTVSRQLLQLVYDF